MSSSIIHPTPKRGGMHPIYGAFVGGGIMDKNYNIVNPRFRCVSQLRTIKQLLSTQNALEQARDNISGVKFHGNLEVEESKLTTELDKRTFIEKVELLVKTYGFQSFFYLQGPDGKMQSLLTHSHLFTLSDVIKEHRKRDGDHVPTLNDEGDETAESIAVGHSKYDDYELMDCSLSRLAVQSVVGRTLQDDIKTRYSHLSDFDLLPGNVYFIMALEASNASVALDIDDAMEKFATLSLTSFPGENVKGLATEALRLIKIMEGGYCLPLKLGSDLIKKVCATSSEHFNRWMHAKLDEVRELELKYKLKDPKLMVSDSTYSELGPVALCGFLQEKYGSLITEKAWPALSATLPSGNLTPVLDGAARRCFHCQSPDHLRNACPHLKHLRDSNPRGPNARKVTPPKEVVPPAKDVVPPAPESSLLTNRKPMPAWRYIEPVDKDSSIVMGDLTFKWCSHCKCRVTGKQGFFTTTHGTSEHGQKKVVFDPEVNHSPIAAPHPPDADAEASELNEDDELVFTGPWHCAIIENDDLSTDVDTSPSVWIAAASVDDDETCDLDFAAVLPTSSSPSDDSLTVTSATSLLLMDTLYQNVYDTRPPLAVVDLDSTEFDCCDNPSCSYLGPVGFNCPKCSDGIYRTAFVRCHHCTSGMGFLGDSCPDCDNLLYGRVVLHTCLPSQHLVSAIEYDPDCAIDRNLTRRSFIRTSSGYFPPAVNWATLSPVPSLELESFLDCHQDFPPDGCPEEESARVTNLVANSEEPTVDPSPEHGSDVTAVAPSLGSVPFFSTWSAAVCLLLSAWFSWFVDYPLTWSLNGIRTLVATPSLWLFSASTIFWDTIEQFLLPPGSPTRSRSTRRRRRPSTLQWFPRHWLLLSSLMLLSGHRSLSPTWWIESSLAASYHRSCRVSALVCMNPITVWDLQKQRYKILKSILFPAVDAHPDQPAGTITEENTGELVSHAEEEEQFYECSDHPSLENQMLSLDFSETCDNYFINCAAYESDLGSEPTLPALNAALSGLNFLDCPGLPRSTLGCGKGKE